jgi:hypothetical protein
MVPIFSALIFSLIKFTPKRQKECSIFALLVEGSAIRIQNASANFLLIVANMLHAQFKPSDGKASAMAPVVAGTNRAGELESLLS